METIEGVVKHNGPLTGKLSTHSKPLPKAIEKYDQKSMDLDLKRFSSLEAQIASLSDDIAYNNHDIDDALRAGLLQNR